MLELSSPEWDGAVRIAGHQTSRLCLGVGVRSRRRWESARVRIGDLLEGMAPAQSRSVRNMAGACCCTPRRAARGSTPARYLARPLDENTRRNPAGSVHDHAGIPEFSEQPIGSTIVAQMHLIQR